MIPCNDQRGDRTELSTHPRNQTRARVHDGRTNFPGATKLPRDTQEKTRDPIGAVDGIEDRWHFTAAVAYEQRVVRDHSEQFLLVPFRESFEETRQYGIRDAR